MPTERLITIKGIPEVEQRLREYPSLIVGSIFAKALEAGAAVIMAEVAARTPERSEGEHSEDQLHLIEGLTFEIMLDSEGRGGRVKVGFGSEGMKALWVEYGHVLKGHMPNEREIGEVPAHPFMRPAADACAEAAVAAFMNTFIESFKGLP